MSAALSPPELTRADLEKTLIEADKLADKQKKISKKVISK